jgi:hypothetical protein
MINLLYLHLLSVDLREEGHTTHCATAVSDVTVYNIAFVVPFPRLRVALLNPSLTSLADTTWLLHILWNVTCITPPHGLWGWTG